MESSSANVSRPSIPRRFVIHFKQDFLLKVHYFLFFGAFGTLYPILNITLRSRGLSDTELSYINIIIPFLVFIMNPLLGFIADHTRRYLSTFNFVFALVTILYTLMFLLPTVKNQHIQVNVIDDGQVGRMLEFCAREVVATKCASRSECGCSYQAVCTIENALRKGEQFTLPFTMNDKVMADSTQTCGILYRVPVEQDIRRLIRKNSSDPFSRHKDRSEPIICQMTCSTSHYCQGQRYGGQMRYIALYSILFILGTTLISNSISLGVSVGFATVLSPDDFGEQRVYGTVGFGIAAFAASRFYQKFQIDLVYIIMFSITAILCILVTSFIRTQAQKASAIEKELDNLSGEKTKKKKKKIESKSRLSTLIPLFKKVDVIVFLSLTCVWGMSYAGIDPYLYLYIDEFAACKSHAIVGWMSLTASIAEVIGFFVAAKLIKCLGTNLASIAILLAFAIRFGGYYFITRPYFLIPMETMHFFNFGILYVLIAQKANSIAPPGLAGTLQGVALGAAFGLGRGIGLPIASFIYTTFEQRRLFLVLSLFNLTAAVIYSIYFLLTSFCAKRKNDQIIIEDNKDSLSKSEPLLVVSTNKPIDGQ